MNLAPLQKLPNNAGNLGKIIVATSFEWLPKVQKIAKSGHTDVVQSILRGIRYCGKEKYYNCSSQ